MILSNDVLAQFVKVTTGSRSRTGETIVYGTTVDHDGSIHVRLDGSDYVTPISTTADTKPGERVMVLIKNHTATITGNMSSPSARTHDVQALDNRVIECEKVVANTVTTKDLEAINADIKNLKTNKLSANDAKILFANIDFSNIGEAAIEHLYATSGLIKDVTISNGTITGELVGVTIKGDLIEGNTVVADKLVIKGSDGLYYKLNTDGMTTETEQTDQNSLNGSVIMAKSITATKISVDDLVAFDATIGGFSITESSIYSGVKSSVNNTTRGVYLDKDGQVAFGDTSNYLKYYKDQNGAWKLAVSADHLLLCNDKGRIQLDSESDSLKLEADRLLLKGSSGYLHSIAHTAVPIGNGNNNLKQSGMFARADDEECYVSISSVRGEYNNSNVVAGDRELSLIEVLPNKVIITSDESNGPIELRASTVKTTGDYLDKAGQVIRNGLAAYTGTADAGIDPNTTLEELVLSSHTNAPKGKGVYYYIKTTFYSTKSTTASRAQFAWPSSTEGSLYHRYYKNGSWSAWIRYMNVDETYPVGSIVVRYDHTSPASLFGGTWTRMPGRFLFGANAADTIGTTGGEWSHTLTVDEMPAHNHGITNNTMLMKTDNSKAVQETSTSTGVRNNTGYSTFKQSGGGAAHNNMPPYITVSIWRRTA